MHVIPIGDRIGLAFGLQWEVGDPFGKRAQIKRLRGAGARFVARFQQTKGKGHSDENLGVTARIESVRKGMTIYSAAGQAAMLPGLRGKNFLIVIEGKDANESTVVAIVGILSGNVIVDAYVPGNLAQAEIDKYHEACRKANAEHILLGQSERMKVQQSFVWDDFMGHTFDASRLQQLAARLGLRSNGVTLGKLRDDTATNAAVVACAVSVVGGYWFYKQSESDAAREAARLRAAEQQSPEMLYRRQLAVLLSQPMAYAKDAIPAIREAIGPIRVNRRGWVLKEINCTMSGCAAIWSREHGTYAEFADQAPKEWLPLHLSEKLDQITHTLPVVIPKANLPAPATWPTFDAFKRDEGSRWQLFSDIKLKTTLKEPRVQALPPGVTEATAAAFPEAVYGATWTVADSQWWLSTAFDKSPATLALSRLQVKFNGSEMQFNGEGVAYVKK